MKLTAFFLFIAVITLPALGQDLADGDPFSDTSEISAETREIEDPTDVGPLEAADEIEPTGEVEEKKTVLTEPLSVSGIVGSVADAEGNEYLVLVVQPSRLVPTSMEQSYTVEVPYTEIVDSIQVTKTKTESQTRTVQKIAANSISPVMIPLSKSMPCFTLQDAIRVNVTDLKVGQHLLVAGSVIEALQVSSEVRETTNRQVELTGLKPHLPKYIVALGDRPKSEQRKSLLETLKEASPYRSATTFFGDMELRDPRDRDTAKNQFRSKRQAEIAWIKARQDFFSNRYETAEPTLNTLIEMKSKEPLVHYLRGIIRFKRGDSDGASEDFAAGAELESARGQSRSINQDLTQVQGVARQALEEYRRYYRMSRM